MTYERDNSHFMIPRLLPRTVLALLLAATAACSSSQVSLEYQPPNISPELRRGPAVVATGRFEDRRGDPPMYLGSIKTPVGTPLEYVETRVPVAQMVANAFGHGLNTRNMLARGGTSRYIIQGQILSLYCDHLARPYAEAKVMVQLVHRQTGRVVHSQIHEAERLLPPRTPNRDSRALLARLSSEVVQEVVDKALDDPGLRAALR